MLEAFISEYKEIYEKPFNDGFQGVFDRFCAVLLEPNMLPSKELKERLNALNTLFYEPVSVAVVGQFSSGKSSLLNAILGSDILPTGVVPVTAKPTFIKYAPQSFLKALYNDGREEFFDISELSAFVDQRNTMKDVKALYIHAPNEILKQISFIDTPGLNSRSAKDTKETLNVLKSSSGLIWLSLIDNAARHGELCELELIPKALKNHALCLLNQKDKLNDDEIARVLEHSKETYSKFFTKIAAVSAKNEREGKADSGFSDIREFLNSFDKDEFLRQNMNEIKTSILEQNAFVLGIFDELKGIICEFDEKYKNTFKELESEYKSRFELIFEELKQNASFIASQIMEHIKECECEYFKEQKSILGKNNYVKTSYKAQILNEQTALNALLYNDEKLAKMFKKLKRDFADLQDKIKSDLSAVFDELREKALDFKASHESIQKSDILHSDEIFANIRQFSCDIYSLFFLHYERELEKEFARLDVFFERMNIKISANYTNAVRLSLAHIKTKIENQRQSFESDPLSFSLYCASIDDIKTRILTELSYYEFEDEINSTSPFISKFLRKISASFDEIKEKNLEFLNEMREKESLKNSRILEF